MLDRIAAAVLALVLLAPPAAAQVLRGTVLDSASRQPVPGTQVVALGVTEAPAGGAVTGRGGEFTLLLPAGSYRLRLRRLGYSSRITQPIGVDSTSEASVQIWLTPVAVSSALHCTVTMRTAKTMFIGKVCSPSIVLDGVLLSPGGTGGSSNVGFDGPLNPFNLEAVEVYPGPESVPVQWGGYLSPCEAIIAWSRR